MAEFTDNWLWFVDEELVDKLMAEDEVSPNAHIRPADSESAGKAVQLHLEGQPAQAAVEVEQALAAGGPSPDLEMLAGHMRFQLGEFSKAAEHFALLRASVPGHPTAAFNLGVCYERQGKFEQAIEALNSAIQTHPRQWQAHVCIGYCQLRLGRYTRALQAFEDSLEINPQSEKSVFGMGVALQFLGRLEEAEDTYLRLMPAWANNTELLSNLVGLAAVRKDHANVRHCAEQLLRLQPDSRVALEGLLSVSFAESDYAAAAKYAAKITELAPADAAAWYNRGLAHQRLKNVPEAARAYREALRLDPRNAQTHANLGALVETSGDHRGAKALYEEALSLHPSPDRLWNLALVCEHLNEPEEAELAYTQMVEIRKDWADAWFRLGTIRYQRGEFERALDAFHSAAGARPGWSEATANAGVCQYRLGRYADAQRSFQSAAESNPASSTLTGQAAAAVAAGDMRAALAAYQPLRTAGTASADMAFRLGLALQDKGDHTAAAGLYRDALAAHPGFAEAMVNLGHAENALGNTAEAKAHWARALELAPNLAVA